MTAASSAPVVEALAASAVDLSRVRVVCDWIQYRDNFREVADLPAGARAGHGGPVPTATPWTGPRAASLRRKPPSRWRSTCAAAATPTSSRWSAALLQRARGSGELHPGAARALGAGQAELHLAFQRAVLAGPVAVGAGDRPRLRAGPAGRRKRRAQPRRRARADPRAVHRPGTTWHRQERAAGRALRRRARRRQRQPGADLAGRVRRARSRAHGRDYYRRLHYLMCDYSQHVLGPGEGGRRPSRRARQRARRSTPRTRLSALGFLRGKVFLVYISNVYDNLPTDEVAQLGGRTYQVETRAYLPGDGASGSRGSVSATSERAPDLIRQAAAAGPGAALPRPRPQHFSDAGRRSTFWRDVWAALGWRNATSPLDRARPVPGQRPR